MTCSRHKERRPAVTKISTVRTFGNEIFKEQKLTIGLDLGDPWSFYCVRDEAGQIILEQKLPTTPEAMNQDLTEYATRTELVAPIEAIEIKTRARSRGIISVFSPFALSRKPSIIAR
jgi:hypothetical protein